LARLPFGSVHPEESGARAADPRRAWGSEARRRSIIEPWPGRREVTNESVAEFLRNYMAEFHKFIVRVYTVLPRDA
jgi:hypothetical protein